jgi:hypothetical protein
MTVTQISPTTVSIEHAGRAIDTESLSTFETPNEADYAHLGGHFGPHNLHENRQGHSFPKPRSSRPTRTPECGQSTSPRPKEVGGLVPAAPDDLVDPRPNRARVIQTADVGVTTDGVVFLTDYSAGLQVAEYLG